LSGSITLSDLDVDAYLIWSREHSLWLWGPGGRGYVQDLSKAGRYSRGEALEICTRAMLGDGTRMGALTELPVRLADLEAMVSAYKARFPQRREPWE
jgi:hypothetical protein